MIYHDEPHFLRLNGRKKYCHVTATTLKELKIAAWWYSKRVTGIQKGHPHFDLPEDQLLDFREDFLGKIRKVSSQRLLQLSQNIKYP